MWYYEDQEDSNDYPVGYYKSFTVITTNVVNGVDTPSFFRTHYSKEYNVFVQYPIDIGCYKNVKIINWYVLFLFWILKQNIVSVKQLIGVFS